MRGNAREHTLDRPAIKQPHSSNLIPPAKRFLQFSLSFFSSIYFFIVSSKQFSVSRRFPLSYLFLLEAAQSARLHGA